MVDFPSGVEFPNIERELYFPISLLWAQDGDDSFPVLYNIIGCSGSAFHFSVCRASRGMHLRASGPVVPPALTSTSADFHSDQSLSSCSAALSGANRTADSSRYNRLLRLHASVMLLAHACAMGKVYDSMMSMNVVHAVVAMHAVLAHG